MSALHTPGPWKVNFKKFSEVRAENGAVVAECKNLTGLVNLQANAKLIAAAPDLLGSLIAITNQLERVGDTRPNKDGQFIDDARAAIEKAVQP